MQSTKTPIYNFPQESPFFGMTIKREDLSAMGSHKFRYLQKKMHDLCKDGIDRVVLSSTGNAGITASAIGSSLDMTVYCLMSDRGDMNKAAQIEAHGGKLIITTRPLRFAKYIAKKYQIPLLRMSTDEQAITAYHSLGEEIIQQTPDAEVIVNFATSGTSSLGIAQAYINKGLGLPAFHIVQSGRSNSVVKALHPEQINRKEESRGVGLTQTPHHEELLQLITESGGDAWYVSDTERKNAEADLQKHQLSTSFEGVSCFVVGKKLLKNYKKVVAIFSGKKWPSINWSPDRIITTFSEIDDLFNV